MLRNHAFCWTKNETLIKTKRNQKWKTPHTLQVRLALCFRSYRSPELKVKLWWVCPYQKGAYFATFSLSKRHFLNWKGIEWDLKIHILLQIKKHYWIRFLLVFKSFKSLQCILKSSYFSDNLATESEILLVYI